ncbi:MAG TPA: ABC transporter ATP-binding protein, partial [Thermoplasmata archaeon]|nr:ABC transporter ATP-binding protein [Thermoplasmata archaeon]
AYQADARAGAESRPGAPGASSTDPESPASVRGNGPFQVAVSSPERHERSSRPGPNRRPVNLAEVHPGGKMGDAIVVAGLTKRYETLTAVDRIDFAVPEGKVFAFLGPNGAGKTTTVEILEGLRQRTDGEVTVLGLDPWADGTELHHQIGVIPQEFRFFEKITPAEAIQYYATLFGVRVDVPEMLARVALSDKADARFDTLSGGQKQKLGLALALVPSPRICFLDEPTTGLDPHARRAIWEVIRKLRNDGRTVFLTTHYLEEAELLADQVGIIHQGKIIARGTPSEIIRQYGRPERLAIEGPPSLGAYLKSRLDRPVSVVDGHVEVQMRDKSDALAVLKAVEESGLPWTGFATVQDTLEDVFVGLVGKMDEGVVQAGSS